MGSPLLEMVNSVNLAFGVLAFHHPLGEYQLCNLYSSSDMGCGNCGYCQTGCTVFEGTLLEGTLLEGTVLEGTEIEGTRTSAPAVIERGVPIQSRSQGLFKTVSFKASTSSAFVDGQRAFLERDLGLAIDTLTEVCGAEPMNALAFYFLALAQREIGDLTAAETTLTTAVELEVRNPIAHWGKRMERVQGERRLWVEKSRRAGLASH